MQSFYILKHIYNQIPSSVGSSVLWATPLIDPSSPQVSEKYDDVAVNLSSKWNLWFCQIYGLFPTYLSLESFGHVSESRGMEPSQPWQVILDLQQLFGPGAKSKGPCCQTLGKRTAYLSSSDPDHGKYMYINIYIYIFIYIYINTYIDR